MKKIMLFVASVILGIMFFSPIFCMAEDGGYLVGYSSEGMIIPSLDLNRINVGSYAAPDKEEEIAPVKKATSKRRRWLWERKVKKGPTPAEITRTKAESALESSKKANVSAKKAEAIAETSLEVSKKAEKTAIEALNSAKKAEAAANESIAAANMAIEAANKAVANTNNAIDKINGLAETLRKEREEEKKMKEVKSYRVKSGDSLIGIAAKPSVYGNASLWKKLFNANRDKIKNPNVIHPGLLLKVPK